MVKLAQFQTDVQEFSLMQNSWAAAIEPLLSSPIVNGRLINDVDLIAGDTIINHRLGRKLVGWIVVGSNAAASIFDKQSLNQMPQLTLVLNSSAPVKVNLYVF
jgi:hypothetical protein